MALMLLYKKLHTEAKAPTRAYEGDAGWDMYTVESGSLAKAAHREFHTGIALEIPKGYYGQLSTRSSFGKQGLVVHPGVIDSGYRGEISIFVRNFGMDYSIIKGDKIAQLLILPVPFVELIEVKDLGTSFRGTSALGSSGR